MDQDIVTTNDTGCVETFGHQDGARPDVRTALDLVRQHLVRLVAELPVSPRTVLVRAGGVTVEVEWPTQAASEPGAVVLPPPIEQPTVVADSVEAHTTPAGDQVRSPAVGVFYRRPEPSAKPFVDVGEAVDVGVQVAIIEVMKLMIPVRTEIAGRLVAVLKEDGDPVAHDEPLFVIEPDGKR